MKLLACRTAAFVLIAMGSSAACADTVVDYGTQIRPILADKCVKCHGPDNSTREAGLRLDRSEGIAQTFAGGNFEKSEAWRRLTSKDPNEQMPPPDSGKAVSPEQLALLKQWMESGAKWAPHWAFVPPQRQEAGGKSQGSGVRNQESGSKDQNEIDAFVEGRLKREGLTLSPQTDKTTLIRRLSFDFTGLPPTLAEIDAFLADDSPQAYEKLVDRLLASPHYGELMAMEWLDGARFADTNGYQNDFERTMWPWRDWVIAAFNANMPFDRFVVEQLAGDLLPGATDSQKLATGFNRNNRTVTESGSLDEEWRVENVVDRTEATSGVFLGLTFGCARCHDHKYDPITQREFYQFYAFFNSVNEKGVYNEEEGNRGPMMQVVDDETRQRLKEADEKIATAKEQLKQNHIDLAAEIYAWLKKQPSDATATPAEQRPPVVQVSESAMADKLLAANDNGGGSEQNRTPQTVERFFGSAIEFDGGELIELGETFQPQREKPFAVAAWVKPQPKNGDEIGAIVSKMDDASLHRGFDTLVMGDGKIAVHLINEWPKNALKVVSKRALPRDAWSHVVVSYNGSSKATGISIIVNGEPWKHDVETDKLRDTLATDQPLRVGRRSTANNFRGELANVAFYDRVISPSEAAVFLADTLRRVVGKLDALSSEQRTELERLTASLPGTTVYEQARALEDLQRQRDKIKNSIPTAMIMEDLAKPRETYLLKRGRYDMPDETAALLPDVPAFLPALPADAPRNRLTLANWMVAPENPLTARVAVNRVWQRMFGVGLVKTAENFGVQADSPSHPELLDWLALELVHNGWDLKRLQRTIALSATYRQTSAASAALYERDPENRLLGRGPRKRLSAESIRDNALAIGGLLVPRIGGRSVRPYQPAGLWDDLAGGKHQKYVQDHGDELYRRSLYTFRKRTVSHPTLSTFDAPSWEVCALKRPSTNTPLQALALLNDVTYAEAARKLAERMIAGGGTTLADRIHYAFRLATARLPSDDELKMLTAGYQRYLAEFRQDPAAAEKLLKVGESPIKIDHDRAELAAYATVASVLLNLDETIVKE